MNDGEFCMVKAIGQIGLSDIESELAEAGEGCPIVTEMREDVPVVNGPRERQAGGSEGSLPPQKQDYSLSFLSFRLTFNWPRR